MWRELEQAGDTPETRELARRFCEEAVAPLVTSGEISQATAVVEELADGTPEIVINTKDLRTKTALRVGQLPPWATRD